MVRPLQLLCDNRLAILAGQIRADHDDAESAVRHGIRAGEDLVEAKALLTHGASLPWLTAYAGFSERTAQAYMRVAKLSKSASVADLRIGARWTSNILLDAGDGHCAGPAASVRDGG
ncbi:MAG: hypothetical protein RL274_2825 [Pseudomonadota bacterium]|jgi:hypothetical protein